MVVKEMGMTTTKKTEIMTFEVEAFGASLSARYILTISDAWHFQINVVCLTKQKVCCQKLKIMAKN
jgi:hypothetical protein